MIVYAEQGLGDIVQFCRYLPLLKQRGATVCFLVAARMHAILRAAFPEISLLADVSQVETHQFDFHCAMMSLPFHFQTTLAGIPAIVPYLKPDPEKTSMWRRKIGRMVSGSESAGKAIQMAKSTSVAVFHSRPFPRWGPSPTCG
jgi:hypothetical protein